MLDYATDKPEYYIADPDGTLRIPLNITMIGVSGDYVVGKCEQGNPPTGFPEDVKGWSIPGYFVLNVKNRSIECRPFKRSVDERG